MNRPRNLDQVIRVIGNARNEFIGIEHLAHSVKTSAVSIVVSTASSACANGDETLSTARLSIRSIPYIRSVGGDGRFTS